MLHSLQRHWPEYLMEAVGLGVFMVSAAVFGTLLEHPLSPVRMAIGEPFVRRVLMGSAMGATALGIIYSRWGRRSGAHINPSVTLTFHRLRKISTPDALFYVAFQFLGGAAGIAAASLALGNSLAAPEVGWVATVPGRFGVAPAFAAEMAISFGLMLAILIATNRPRLAPYTGLIAAVLLATYITVEAPVSGMSMNPARTLASALPAGTWSTLWIYFLAPPAGMLLAAAAYARAGAGRRVLCAKLHHDSRQPCIFCCSHPPSAAALAEPSPARPRIAEAR
jgi:aquaporin Z